MTDLGALKGKILLFGGVYSNLQSLRRLIEIAHEHNIPADHCICTGDLIGYCAQPEETIALFREWGALSIKGNVEEQLVAGASNCGCDFTEGGRCDSLSQIWYPYAQKHLSDASLQWLESLPDHIAFHVGSLKTLLVHGSFTNISEFIFESTSTAIKLENFKQSQSDVIIAGHTGLPFAQKIGKRVWINPGVIGMPANDGSAAVWYSLLEVKEGSASCTFYTYEYDALRASQLMEVALLPEAYAKTLRSGIWDNMEILPPFERGRQGYPIDLKKVTFNIST